MTVPANSNTGRVLRLRGKGVRGADGSHGDEYVTLKIVLPEGGNAALADFLRGWAPQHAYDPRRGMRRHDRHRRGLRLFAGLQEAELERWIGERWVRPEPASEGYVFREVDVARVRLIVELRHDLAIDEDALPVVLQLLDQVYALRRRLRAHERGDRGTAAGCPRSRAGTPRPRLREGDED